MAEIRDKGKVPLAKPDAKVYAVRDEVTGYIAACVLDLSAKKYALWFQPWGDWHVGSYGNVDITDAQLAIHDGRAKLMAVTWKDTSPDGPHLIVVDLEKVY